MRYEIHANLTPGRRAWMESLESGPARRSRGPIGSQCMRLGWTRWVSIADSDLEELTDAGRAALTAWRAQQKGE